MTRIFISNLSRLAYIKRHISELLTHLTIEKIVNLVINLVEKYFRVSNLRSYPAVIKIDPGPFCQLRCPLCFHTNEEFNKRFKLEDNLTIEKLVKIIEPLKKKLVYVSLSLRGEPFMNPYLIELIEYIHKSNIAVSFSTNFSIKLTDNQIERIAKSGLNKMSVALDGASQETNEKYRVGSNFELILSNVKKLASYKKKYKLSSPKIIWKFVVFDHNKKDIPFVKENYKLLGFDSYKFVHDVFGDTTVKARKKQKGKGKICYWIWHTMIIQSDGQVNPCCDLKNFNIGNAFESNIHNLWNNEVYQSLRKGFKKNNFPNDLHEMCKSCYS
ncbi:MAG: radical SAM protein [Bacteroidales bacterium]|nr:radical SAM protein [Bacteroidales bacterium]